MKYVVRVNCAAPISAPSSTTMRLDVCAGALEIEVSRLDEPQPQRAHGLDAFLGEQVVVEVLDPGNAVPAGVRLHDLAMRVNDLGRDRLVARAVDVQDRDAFQLTRREA